MMVDADDMREASSRSWGDLAWSSFFRHWTRMCMGMHWGRCGWMASSSRFGLVWFAAVNSAVSFKKGPSSFTLERWRERPVSYCIRLTV